MKEQLYQMFQWTSTQSSMATLAWTGNPTVFLTSTSFDHMIENNGIVSSLDFLAGGSTFSVQDIEIANTTSSLSLLSILCSKIFSVYYPLVRILER